MLGRDPDDLAAGAPPRVVLIEGAEESEKRVELGVGER